MADEHLGGAREPHAAAVALHDRLADLALERGELLGDGGRREVEHVGRRRERAVLGDLAQDPQAADVDHAVDLTDLRRNVYSLLCVSSRRMHAMPARSAALLVLVAFIWGVNFVAIHVGLDHFPPLLFSALRFTLVAIPAVFFVKRPPVAWKYVAAVGFMLGVVKFGLVFISIDIGLPAGLASLRDPGAGALHDLHRGDRAQGAPAARPAHRRRRSPSPGSRRSASTAPRARRSSPSS